MRLSHDLLVSKEPTPLTSKMLNKRAVMVLLALVHAYSPGGAHEMEPMFLPDVEKNPQPCPHLFAFHPTATDHLARFTQEIMRGPAPISPGLRELIAAYTSNRNHCPF